MLIDSHCHLDRVSLKPYGGVFSRFMEESLAAGIEHLLCVAIDLPQFPAMRTLVEPYSAVSLSVGMHPNERPGAIPEPSELMAFAEDPRVVAIGETGLDYYRSEGDLGWQQERFRRHIAVARACSKPLIIHSRDAGPDTLSILREGGAQEVGGVLHCFTDTWETAQAAMALGFYISFSGILTYQNTDPLREVAQKVPLDRLLIETDCPYLTPAPYRGRPNEPRFVARVAEVIAELRGLTPEAVALITRDNFYRLFALSRPAAGS